MLSLVVRDIDMYHLALVNWDDVTIIDWALGARIFRWAFKILVKHKKIPQQVWNIEHFKILDIVIFVMCLVSRGHLLTEFFIPYCVPVWLGK